MNESMLKEHPQKRKLKMELTPATRFPLLFKIVEVFIIFFSFVLVSVNSLIRFRQFPEVDNYSDNEGGYVVVAVLILLAMVFMLWKHHLLAEYLSVWKLNVPLLAFLFYAVLSLAWSVYIPATLYKLIFLFFSSLAGAYLAIRYRVAGVLTILSWVSAICCVLSVLLVVFLPFVGVMQNQLFLGSWTGLFWHRNHTGNIFAFFSILFLFRALFERKLSLQGRIILSLLYLLSAAMVFGSRSATGIIVFLFLHFILGLVFLWLKFYPSLKPWHYYLAGAVLLAGFLIFITNTAFFFGLLGRSSTMTGRIPLWQDLIQRVYLQKPIFGYGYGALWMQKSFRIQMQLHHHWDYQVYFADNGFFDILLNMGIVGLILFLSVYVPAGLRSFRAAITSRSWLAFFPLVTFLYIFIGNLTYSFLLEVDQFVWMLLVIMVFLTTAPKSKSIPQP